MKPKDPKTFTIHPIAAEWPDMLESARAELKANIYKHGLKLPITVWHDMVIDGRQRLWALGELEMDVRANEIEDVSELTEDQAIALVYSRNKHRRAQTMTNVEKREEVEAELKTHPEESNREIARRLGVGHQLVSQVRSHVDESSTSSQNPAPTAQSGTEAQSAPTQTATKTPARKAGGGSRNSLARIIGDRGDVIYRYWERSDATLKFLKELGELSYGKGILDLIATAIEQGEYQYFDEPVITQWQPKICFPLIPARAFDPILKIEPSFANRAKDAAQKKALLENADKLRELSAELLKRYPPTIRVTIGRQLKREHLDRTHDAKIAAPRFCVEWWNKTPATTDAPEPAILSEEPTTASAAVPEPPRADVIHLQRAPIVIHGKSMFPFRDLSYETCRDLWHFWHDQNLQWKETASPGDRGVTLMQLYGRYIHPHFPDLYAFMHAAGAAMRAAPTAESTCPPMPMRMSA